MQKCCFKFLLKYKSIEKMEISSVYSLIDFCKLNTPFLLPPDPLGLSLLETMPKV